MNGIVKLLKGKFITIEGIDGSGKTSFSKELFKRLQDFGLKVYSTFEPTKYPQYGLTLRELLSDKTAIRDTRLESDLAMKDRYVHVYDDISPKLKQGYTVICDRYVLSNVVYQDSTDNPAVRIINQNYKVFKFPKPDYLLYITIPVEEALRRISYRGNDTSIFENKDHLINITCKYEKYLPYENNVIRVSGLLEPADMVEAFLKEVGHRNQCLKLF